MLYTYDANLTAQQHIQDTFHTSLGMLSPQRCLRIFLSFAGFCSLLECHSKVLKKIDSTITDKYCLLNGYHQNFLDHET